MSGEAGKLATPWPRGRGAVGNVQGRFDRYQLTPFDDGWGSLDQPPPPLETTVIQEPARSILSKNDSPDILFDRSINPYKGCEHGCFYCFARPSHSFLDMSPGLDFESKIVSKPNASELLVQTLSRPRYRPEVIALGANTDPYQPIERTERVTRGILEVLCDFRHPFSIVTKSNLVLRDLDLLVPAARAGRAHVWISITTLDRELARKMEPRAPTPQRRLQAVRELTETGVPVGVLASPMIPAINDAELEAILEAGKDHGALAAGSLLVRLPHELKELFTEWLEAHFPDRSDKVLNRLRDMRRGRLNDPRFGSRMRGEGVYAELLQRRFEVASTRLGLKRKLPALDTSSFRVPPAVSAQGRLFA